MTEKLFPAAPLLFATSENPLVENEVCLGSDNTSIAGDKEWSRRGYR